MVDMRHAEVHPLADVQEIEQELTHLWREAGSIDQPVMRSRVLTLVSIADEAREDEMVDALVQLSSRHPARNILLLLGEEQDEDQLDAAATLLCNLRGHALCAEQIYLHATGAARARLPSAVRSLLMAELPVALWWTLPPDAESTLFSELADMVDHLFFDSSTLARAKSLTTLPLASLPAQLTDLNWRRLSPWREMIARFFDPPEQRSHLAALDHVTIEHGACLVGAWLIVGWLANQLEWRIEEAIREEASIMEASFTKAEGGTVLVRIKAVESRHPIQAVTLHAGATTFRVHRTMGSTAACEAEREGQFFFHEMLPLGSEEEVALLSQALDEMELDDSYADVLVKIQEIWGAEHRG